MTTTTTKDVYYALRERDYPHRLVRLDITSNGDADFCNEYSASLSFYSEGPVYRAETEKAALTVLAVDTPWYNSSEERPQWGSINVNTLEVVKVEEVLKTTVTASRKPLPVVLTAVDARSSTRAKCSKDLGRELPDDKALGYWSVRYVVIPEKETFGTLQEKCQNTHLLIGGGTPIEYYSWGVFMLSDEEKKIYGKENKVVVGLVTSANPPIKVSKQ